VERTLICIECPKGCAVTVMADDCHTLQVRGNACPRGEIYARAEVTNPLRLVTSTMRTKGLSLPLVPVRTEKPIPKAKVMEAIGYIRKQVLDKPVQAGESLNDNFLGLDVRLIATRSVHHRQDTMNGTNEESIAPAIK